MPADSLDNRSALRSATPFRRLSDAALEEVLDQVEEIYLQPGQIICRQGSPADSFYVVAGGKVRLSGRERGASTDQATLSTGDCLGEEVTSSHRWEKSASAIVASSLLRISARKLTRLMARYPEIKAGIQIKAETGRLARQAGLSFLQNDEVIYFLTRKHPIFLFGKLVFPTLLALLFIYGFVFLSVNPFGQSLLPYLVAGTLLGVSILWGLWNLIDWHNDYSIVTSQRLIWLERIAGFYDSRQEAPLNTVLSVDVRTSQLGRLFGYGDVVIRTYSGTVLFQGVRRPRQVAALVEDHWYRVKESSRREEAAAIDRAIRQRLGQAGAAADDPAEGPGDGRPANRLVKPGAVPTWVSTMLHMRFEHSGIITYRKHWFVLIQQTWKPLFWFVVGIAIAAARVFEIFTLFSVQAVLLVCGLFAFGVSLWLLYEYLDWRNDLFLLTDDQVVDLDRKPFGKEEKKSAPLENILSIQYQRLGLVGLIFNFGTVSITVGNTKLTFDYVFNPSRVQEDIYNRMSERSARKKQKELEEQRERVSEWFASYAEIQRETQDQTAAGDEWEDYPDSGVF